MIAVPATAESSTRPSARVRLPPGHGIMCRTPAYADPITATGGAHGVFGPGTEQVVREFQRRSDLTADGIVVPATRAALATHGVQL